MGLFWGTNLNLIIANSRSLRPSKQSRNAIRHIHHRLSLRRNLKMINIHGQNHCSQNKKELRGFLTLTMKQLIILPNNMNCKTAQGKLHTHVAA